MWWYMTGIPALGGGWRRIVNLRAVWDTQSLFSNRQTKQKHPGFYKKVHRCAQYKIQKSDQSLTKHKIFVKDKMTQSLWRGI
jgi:hypothetical protein